MSIFGLFSAGNDYDIISEQILEYYRFHKKIESIFLIKNTNEEKEEEKEEIYFINYLFCLNFFLLKNIFRLLILYCSNL